MASSKKTSREAKARVARMEANQAMYQEQVQRRKRDNLVAIIAILAAVAIASVLALTVFAPKDGTDAAADSTATPTATASADATPSATPSAQETNSAGVASADTAKGKTFTGTLTLNGQPMGVELDGTKAPQAAAVFKQLADEGFMTGKSCHRLTNSPDFELLQCGSLKGDGNGDPSFQWGPVENSPADGKYPAGTIAVARGNGTYTNGTQFFITYGDTTLPQDTGGYTIVGKVTSGLDAVKDIAAGGIEGGASDGAPTTKVTIDSFQLN
ncbi:peptidyl-prolyl cis-trans isomerase B (cyclophilin B) [Arthrobacter stackebrandtii]|uniref:peptidylprolyl isomerase n=1 Tax=Arthrobacter stackebrandtii TaxID=272161 RepID=A0ABS4Z013_9MICC|nr:peptidylprolyl isomerase [Arthrobacter stackebrandtii]MBP2414386.1 peptidyl-prolyl cis-trans isomerase B (cyclophilin B) [Arthrobacter stackebrandtii]PYH01523.1 peptidyl-prolyl cis-trans isomerase [Arthrobacter stackebrandtii]